VREFVLDSSAVLALMFDEPGQEIVAAHRTSAIISSVNLGEVLTRLVDRGQSLEDALVLVASLQMATIDHSSIHAAIAASLRPTTKHLGLSYGDRACLGLAVQQQRPILTADRVWSELNLGIEIRIIR
jgi:PIN domain nuclease of toxin-antitoxin system